MSELALFDEALRRMGYPQIAGVDEAGRGPLAGPVIAAAVILGPEPRVPGVRDSKQLSPRAREALVPRILSAACEVSLGCAWQDEIDSLNIRVASILAMSRALSGLRVLPDLVLVDGRDFPEVGLRGMALVRGDCRSEAVAAASILAKVARDHLMDILHTLCPEYGFNRNKGYPTLEHLACIARHGPSIFHRMTFKGTSR
ncbi:MAG: ribonuclease HII [Firmicutes bacterium]|jgi:ribonuclease HII|nr:ribonuclease HII [Bacillota bacterium]